jgi:hypothetical protein
MNSHRAQRVSGWCAVTLPSTIALLCGGTGL